MKKYLLQTPLASPLKKIEAKLQKSALLKHQSHMISSFKTVYCISPYKTGTTFLATNFQKKVSAHEPCQYLSLIEFENDFDVFFIKRLNFLNLKLECSGFLSAYVEELVAHDLTKNLNYISIIRDPSSWITSVVNYWSRLKHLNFDYIDQLFWQKKVGVSFVRFTEKSDREKRYIIDRAIDFYLTFTQNTFRFANITHVEIQSLEEYANEELAPSINASVVAGRAFKRQNKKKAFSYSNPEIDYRYRQILSKGGVGK